MPEDIGLFNKFLNHQGGGMFLLLRLCYISLIIYCLLQIENLQSNQDAWFRKEVRFSDWRNVKKVEYSTNAIVTNWYTGGHSKYLRQEQQKEIQTKINNGDTVTIGLDFNALAPISRMYFTDKYLASVYDRLYNEEVITIKIWGKNDLIYMNEY